MHKFYLLFINFHLSKSSNLRNIIQHKILNKVITTEILKYSSRRGNSEVDAAYIFLGLVAGRDARKMGEIIIVYLYGKTSKI